MPLKKQLPIAGNATKNPKNAPDPAKASGINHQKLFISRVKAFATQDKPTAKNPNPNQ